MVDMCRICMAAEKNMKNIFSSFAELPQIYTAVMECAPVQIYPGDNLPTFICSQCLTNLNGALQFKNLCVQTDAILRRNIHSEFEIKTESVDDLKEEFDSLIEPLKTNDDSNSESLLPFYIGNINDENDCLKNESLNIEYYNNENKAENLKTEAVKFKKKRKLERYDYSDIKIRSDGRFECNLCNSHYKSKYHLKRHKLEHNITETNMSVCEICGKRFTRKDKLIAHQKVHSGKSKKCDQCDKTFYSNSDVKRHVASIHMNAEPKRKRTYNFVIKIRSDGRFQCDLCDNHYKEKCHLKRHRLTHTSNALLICDLCGKGFNRNEHLKTHQKIHTGERNYICKYCEKAFISTTHLARHVRIHLGLKPHKCKFCPKAFTQKKTLQNHIRTHTGERPYSCEICGKSFTRKHHLKTHKTVHTGEKISV